jgi:methionine synthase I (cobalamin-dependent)
MDGGMGTELQRAGLQPEECGEHWTLSRPASVRQIHNAYVQAGAECLLANTFQANPINLARFGLRARLDELNAAAIELARSVSSPGGFVIADVGPIMSPNREEFGDWHALAQTVRSLASADGLLLETCSTPRALEVAQFIRHRVPDADHIPLLLSLSYQTQSGRLTTRSGHSPETFARHAARHGVEVLGVNCGRDIGMHECAEIIRRYRQVTELPLFARPNAGTPCRQGSAWAYPISPQAMAEHLPELLEAGITLIGGCCGTTPEHIAALRPIVDAWNGRHRLERTCVAEGGPSP